MSAPTGAQAIAGIDTSNFYYLYDENEVRNVYNKNEWLGIGGPKFNVTTSTALSEEMVYTALQAVPDKGRVIDNPTATSIFADYPALLSEATSKGDLVFDSTPRDLYVSFLEDRAGYTNAFGYYFYYVDGNGTKHLLESTDNSEYPTYSTSGNYYNATLVFPNASEIGKSEAFAEDKKQDHGQLKCADTRHLKGNLPDGRFADVRVGFFLVPDGYANVRDGVVFQPSKPLLHTTEHFNPNYDAESSGSGVQSILVSLNGTSGVHVLGFEDLERPNTEYHADMGDVIFALYSDPPLASTGISQSLVPVPVSVLKQHRCGARLTFSESDLPNVNDTAYNYKVVHEITMANAVEATKLRDTLSKLIFKFPVVVTRNGTVVTVEITVTGAELQNYRSNNQVVIDYFKKTDNLDAIVVLDEEQRTRFQVLIDYQHQYVNSPDLVSQNMYLKQIDPEDAEIDLVTENSVQVSRLVDNAMLWGDPHIQPLFGDAFTMIDDKGSFTMFDDGQLLLSAYFDCVPEYTEHEYEILRTATFVRNATLMFCEKQVSLFLDMTAAEPPSTITVVDEKNYNGSVRAVPLPLERDGFVVSRPFKVMERIYSTHLTPGWCIHCRVLDEKHVDEITFRFLFFPEDETLRNMVTIANVSSNRQRNASGLLVKKED